MRPSLPRVPECGLEIATSGTAVRHKRRGHHIWPNTIVVTPDVDISTHAPIVKSFRRCTETRPPWPLYQTCAPILGTTFLRRHPPHSTVASRKLHPIISPWSWILASYDRGGSQRVPRKGSAQNWPGRLSMTVIAGSVVDDLPSGTRDDTHRASLCFHECTWGILIFVLLLSLWLPRSPSLPLPPRWLHHDMPASGTASTITASGSRF